MQKVKKAGWTIDYDADAAYLKLTDGAVTETHCFGIVNVDVDASGNAVGIELLTLHPLGEKSNAQLVEAGWEFLAEFKRECGPIPDEVIADIQRRWSDA